MSGAGDLEVATSRGEIKQQGINVLVDLYNEKSTERAANDVELAAEWGEQHELGMEMTVETEETIQKAGELRDIYVRANNVAHDIKELLGRGWSLAAIFNRENDEQQEGPYVWYGGKQVPFRAFSPTSTLGIISVHTDKLSTSIPIGSIRSVKENEEQVEGTVQLVTNEYQTCEYSVKRRLFRREKLDTALGKKQLSAIGLSVRTEGADELSLETFMLYPADFEGPLTRKDIRDDRLLLEDESRARNLDTVLSRLQPLFELAKSEVDKNRSADEGS